MRTDTAFQAWDESWRTEAGRADWLAPDPHVVAALPLLAARGARTALDIGAGVGRHARLLAAEGLAVTAVDMSEAGLEEIDRLAGEAGLAIATERAPFTALPFAEARFDYVLAFNVIYHGDGAVVRQALAEIRRVLKPGGLFQGTMLSKRNADFGLGEEIATDTFVLGGEGDKAHPHFFCSAAGLVSLLSGFELLSLEDLEQRQPGHWHWQFLAERLG